MKVERLSTDGWQEASPRELAAGDVVRYATLNEFVVFSVQPVPVVVEEEVSQPRDARWFVERTKHLLRKGV